MNKYIAALLTAAALPVWAGTATITIDPARPGPRINPHLYGIFLEEINSSVDGGLYAELVANRGFEESRPPDGCELKDGRWKSRQGWDSGFEATAGTVPHWSLVKGEGARGSMVLETTGGLNTNTPCCLRIDTEEGQVGAANEGFWGMAVAAGEQYDLSLFARGRGSLQARLEDSSGLPISKTATLSGLKESWNRLEATLKADKTEPKGRLVILASGPGSVWLDFVSLFPHQTWKQHGLRPDLAQMIADLKPGFVRFPGGCVVEGGNIESAYNWRDSVGPVAERRESWSAWNHRRTYGMGFFEYLQFCEDVGAEPLWVNFAGMSCIFRNAEVVPMDGMGRVVTNFLDGLEFANGPASSKWGALRAASGHARPFGLKLLEISNESGGAEFPPRYRMVQQAVHAAWPDIQCIADFSWISHDLMKDCAFDIEDNHIYSSCQWFVANEDVYRARSRKLPPLYLGELAVTSGDGGDLKGNLRAALSEGIFMMGCERNGDVVKMISYAPLVSHVTRRNGWHGMIYHDSSRSFGTVSYYLWKLFGHNRPSQTLATEVSVPEAKPAAVTGGVGVGTWNTAAEFKDLRVERAGQPLSVADWQEEGGRWTEQDGVRRQNDPVVGLGYFGNESWSDYTLTLKARKLSGAEGFLIVFGRQGGEKYWWNVGGWGNHEHGIEFNQNPVGKHVAGTIETGRWYDVKIELAGSRIRCSLDGKLIHDETVPAARRLYASAGRDEATGEVILKAINTGSEAITTRLNGNGLVPGKKAQCTILTSSAMSDNNSMEQPRRVIPVSREIVLGDTHEFPAYSLTILRIPASN
jgi:alpha-L-arabinofuranosidase